MKREKMGFLWIEYGVKGYRLPVGIPTIESSE